MKLSKAFHTSLTSHAPGVGRVKIRVKFIAMLPEANLKQLIMYGVGTEYIPAELGVNTNAKDHLGSHIFFKSCGFCVACEAYRHIGITLSGVCPPVRLCPSGSHILLSYKAVSQATYAFIRMLSLLCFN